MNIQTIEKASAGAIREALESKNLISFGGNQNGFDVFDFSVDVEKSQCFNCTPPLTKPRGKVLLCADCRAETEHDAQSLFNNFKKHRVVHKLDCWCDFCNKPKTLSMMSKRLPICRACALELKDRGSTAQNYFVEKVKANIGRRLKAAV